MRKIIFLLLLFISLTLFADITNITPHKHRFIELVNSGEFELAEVYMPLVEDWTFDSENDSDYLDIEKAQNFGALLDSLHVVKIARDNYLLYLNDQVTFYVYYLYNKGNYFDATKYYLESLRIYKEVLGENHPDYATFLNNLGVLYKAQGNNSKAEHYYLESLRICKEVLGENHPSYASSLHNLGELYHTQGNYTEAEKCYLESLRIYKEVLGEKHPDYATILNNLGVLYKAQGNYSAAEQYYLESLRIRKDVLGEDHPDYANSLNNLGSLYQYQGNYSAAEQYYLESLRIHKEVLGENHPDYASSLNNLGVLYKTQSNYSAAEQYYLESLRIRKKVLGEKHPDYAMSLNDMGDLYYAQGNYSATQQYYLESLRIYKEVLGANHPNYATILNNLGSLYQTQGNYSEAEHYYLESLRIRKKVLGEKHPDYAMSLNDMGCLYYAQGNYSAAEQYYLESLRISKDVLGEDHPDYANSLNNLGSLYQYQGNYSAAEQYYLESLRIHKEVLGENHPDYARCLNNLGALYKSQGNYFRAEQYYWESLQIRKDVLGENHPSYATCLNNLGMLYHKQGSFLVAEQYYLESLRIQKDVLGVNHPSYAISLNNLGVLYEAQGHYSESEKYHLESLHICKEVLGENHPEYACCLNNLGVLYESQGNYSEAEHYYLESLRIRKEVLGENHPRYASSLYNLGSMYYKQGKYSATEKYLVQSFCISKHSFLTSLNYMTEHDRILFWETLQEPFEYTYPLFAYNYHFTNPSISTFAYDNELFRKGLLLNSADAVRRSVLESGDSVLIEQWNELTEAKQVVMHLEEKEPNSNQLDIYRHRADSLEKIMTISSSAFRQSKEQWNINWESVKKQLSKNEVAIEYFSAPLSQDSTMYCALVLRHNSKYPELIPLFEEKEIASYLDKSTEGSTNNLYSFEGEGEHISNIVWSKILSKINPGETIYFSPTGILHQLAIEYLPYDEQRTMSDVYNMVRLSSTREIVTNKSKEVYKSAIVYGGISYDVDSKDILAESNCYPELKHRSLENDSINRGSADFLPGTKEEAEMIEKLLADNKIESIIYKTKSANEESFKSLSGKHNNILHIATHGFTWTDSTARKQDYFAERMQMQLMGDNQMRGPIIDPLDRCGLLFAGANTALQGKSKELPEGVQDGILTAKEISLMDLRDAELVVLSACETAKGDITSEGVFGLQRAFKMAGAKTIIMSLWKVDDRATQLLMTEFYTNWISKKQPKREAFKNAQNTVKNQYPEPSYWAGFVMLD